MREYICKTNVLHDKEPYPRGSKIILSDKEARSLLEQGHIAEPEEFAAEAAVAESILLSNGTLSKLTAVELALYASRFNVAGADLTKAQIIEELTKVGGIAVDITGA